MFASFQDNNKNNQILNLHSARSHPIDGFNRVYFVVYSVSLVMETMSSEHYTEFTHSTVNWIIFKVSRQTLTISPNFPEHLLVCKSSVRCGGEIIISREKSQAIHRSQHKFCIKLKRVNKIYIIRQFRAKRKTYFTRKLWHYRPTDALDFLRKRNTFKYVTERKKKKKWGEKTWPDIFANAFEWRKKKAHRPKPN